MQAGVNISTNENTLEVKYGMYELGPEREGARTSLKYIYSDVNDIKTYYIRLGFHLDEFERCKYYEDFGFLTMAEFCEVNLGMDKSAVSRCINVFKEFCKRNYNDYGIGTCTMYIDDKWSAYSYSQLCEMLPLDDETRRQVTSDMSVKKIRELKKKKTAEPPTVATSQLVEDEFEYVKLFVADELEEDEFLSEMFTRFRGVLEFLTLDAFNYQRSGKQLSFEDINGNRYSILYRVIKKKES